MDKIERAAGVVGIQPTTLVRRASVAAAHRILEAAIDADPKVSEGPDSTSGKSADGQAGESL